MKIMACSKEKESTYEVHKVFTVWKAWFPDLDYDLIIAMEQYVFGTPLFPPDIASRDYSI